MKNKKGFTLVELIAVIVIIGVLVLITLPTIERITKENNNKVYQQQLDNIILSLKSWASDNRFFLPEEENEILTMTLENLKSEGYIEYQTKNPLTGKCFDNNMLLIIKKTKKSYTYSIDLDTVKETGDCGVTVDRPMLALNGNIIENVEVNSVYVDKGVIAKDKDGNDITDDVSISITGSGNVIDTSRIGNQYVVVYLVTSNDITTQVSRTIKIVDTTPPELLIPGNITIDKAVTSLSLLDGVSATDNSGESITINTKQNIVFGNYGKYTITYTATDSSGNTATKKRTVSIARVTNGYMSSDFYCIKDKGSVCPNGTEVTVQVNSEQEYKFYVIKDTGTKLTLIMSENLGEEVSWYEEEDCWDIAEGVYKCNLTSSHGPLNALRELKGETIDWKNIGVYSYTLDSEIAYTYSGDYVQNVRARLPKLSDFEGVGCSIPDAYSTPVNCPNGLSWLVEDLREGGGYWLSDAFDNYTAWHVAFKNVETYPSGLFIGTKGIQVPSPLGLRPVIEMSK